MQCAAARYLPRYMSGVHTFTEAQAGLERHSPHAMKPEDTLGRVVAIHHWRLSGISPVDNLAVDWGDGTQSILPESAVRDAWEAPRFHS